MIETKDEETTDAVLPLTQKAFKEFKIRKNTVEASLCKSITDSDFLLSFFNLVSKSKELGKESKESDKKDSERVE